MPILYIGVKNLDLALPARPGEMQLYNPVIVRWMIQWVHPEWADRAAWVSVSQLNPFFMAGWVGMLITGLNMLPVSQLDGGHTIYGLFGRDAYKIARAFIIVAIVYMILYLEQAAIWTPMLILVILLGDSSPADGGRQRGAGRFPLDPGRGFDGDSGAVLSAAGAEAVDPDAVLSTEYYSTEHYGASSNRPGRGEVALHFVREAGGGGAVDQAMVVGDRERHHQARDELFVVHMRHDAAAADQQDRDLRRVDDRRRVGAADRAQVADGECAALRAGRGRTCRRGPCRPALPISEAICEMLLRSASRRTGTTRPRSVSTAMPMFTYSL